jgi:DNA-binding NarL/FixJ family response regulator
MMPATIFLVDDHPVFRQGIRLLLKNEKDLEVVGESEMPMQTSNPLSKREMPPL